MTSIRRRSLGALAAAAVLPVRRARAQKASTPVSTQLGWLRNGEFAPLMVAQAKGWFAEEGIDHTIKDGGPGKNPIPIVAVGQAQFGLATSGLYLLSARTARDPVDVVAVGSLYQTSPSSYIELAAPGAAEPVPKDLVGKRVGVQAGSEYILAALARKNGVDPASITMVTVQGTAEPLLVGRVDFFSGWVTNQTYQIEQETAKADAPAAIRGKTWRALRFGQWGLPAYSDVIFCTGKTMRENPAMVTGYLRAVGRGIDFIKASPEEAMKLVAAFPGQIEDMKKLEWRWRVQTPLFSSAGTAAHGPLWMDAATWQEMAQFFYDAKQVPRLVPPAEVMTDALLPRHTSG